MRIRLAQDTVSQGDLDALADWIRGAPRLTKGALTDEMESRFAQMFGVEHAILVSSGSSANLLAVNALIGAKRTPRKVAIAPAVSWVTTVTPLTQLGFDVSLCDCDTTSLGPDLNQFEDLCRTKKPDVAIIVHVLGHDAGISDIKDICDRHNVVLIEDSCEAIGSTVQGRHLGSFGDFGTFSFYFGHQISTIEGGILITDDHELAQVARSMRAHGWARDLDPEFRDRLERENNIDWFESLYTFYYSGLNCRPTDLNAFLGLRQIALLEDIVSKRHANYDAYARALDAYWMQTSATEKLSSFAYGMVVENRLEVARALFDAGVETRPLICGNMGRQPVFRHLAEGAVWPNADRVHTNGLYLPNHAHLSDADIADVSAIVTSVAQPLDFKPQV